eukprot:scaffold2729_cov403-Prasinococcus_capsulatus_cf.AAC.14
MGSNLPHSVEEAAELVLSAGPAGCFAYTGKWEEAVDGSEGRPFFFERGSRDGVEPGRSQREKPLSYKINQWCMDARLYEIPLSEAKYGASAILATVERSGIAKS